MLFTGKNHRPCLGMLGSDDLQGYQLTGIIMLALFLQILLWVEIVFQREVASLRTLHEGKGVQPPRLFTLTSYGLARALHSPHCYRLPSPLTPAMPVLFGLWPVWAKEDRHCWSLHFFLSGLVLMTLAAIPPGDIIHSPSLAKFLYPLSLPPSV